MALPVTVDPKIWMLVLPVYVTLASGLPVWLMLQPRDYLNSYLLYAMMALLCLMILMLYGLSTRIPRPTLASARAGS